MAADRALALGLLLAIAGCEGSLAPLRRIGEAGRDPIVVFVGGTGRAGGDLFAVRTEGGEVVPLTYSGVGEMRPALAPDGGAVAFLRGESLRDSMPGTVWVMNLLSGKERQLRLPKGAGRPERVGWTGDGRRLVIAAEDGLYRIAAPPASETAERVPPADRAEAESTLAVLVGGPAFGRVLACGAGEDLCIAGADGKPAPLAIGARDPARWGTDSVAYVVSSEILVRPLGPGRARRLELAGGPRGVRQITVFGREPRER